MNNQIKEPKGWILLKNGKSVRTGEVKLSFPRLFELDPTDQFNPDKYTTNILLTEEEKNYLTNVVFLNCYNDAIKTYRKWGGKQPNNVQLPEFKALSDDEMKLFYPTGAPSQMYTVRAKTNRRPLIIDLQTNAIQSQEEIYSGVIVRLTLEAYPWSAAGRAGMSFALGVVQKVADAPRVGGSPANDVTVFQDTSDVDFDAIGGGDPFGINQQQQPQPQAQFAPQAQQYPQQAQFAPQMQQQPQQHQQMPPRQGDSDLLMPMPPQQAPQQVKPIDPNNNPFFASKEDSLPF